MTKLLRFLILICFVLMLSPLAVAQKQHAFIWNNTTGIQDIGTLGGDTSYALYINDSGEVVGYSYIAGNITTHAFTWTPAGGMVDLGTLPGGSSTQGNAINSAGDIAGNGIDANGKQVPLYWSPGGRFVALPENKGDSRNYGFGINDFSDVTGQHYFGEIVRGYLWSRSNLISDIGTLPGGLHSVGNAINNLRHITGTASLPNGRFDAILWMRARGMRDIGVIAGGAYTAGEAVNDNDEVAGIGFDSGNRIMGFYWSGPTGMHLLQTLGGIESAGFGINRSGAIAGYSATPSGSIHAALWPNYTGSPQDLGTLPGGVNSYARGINNLGQVVGYADVP